MRIFPRIMIGSTLSHYEIVANLGQGGMGEVYVAEDSKLHRRVALKVLPGEMANDPERRARFEREARAVAALNHPNIVTVYSVEEADGTHFITMELVEGRTLATMLPKDGFSLRELLDLSIPLADAVSSAYRKGITHRDLKPDNLMVDDEGRLRVLDFGLAKAHDPKGVEEAMTQAPTATVETEEGKVLGTVAYMSPEQAEGKAVDPRSDIFSLGTVLFEMATGERPFRGDTSMSIISSILRDGPPPVTERNRTLPRHLGRIIRRCLAKDPDRRYQTALDLRNELQELKAEIDSGEHAAGAESHGKPLMSVPIVPVLFAVVAVAGIVAVFVVRPWTGPERAEVELVSRPITSTMEWAPNLFAPGAGCETSDKDAIESLSIQLLDRTAQEFRDVLRIAVTSEVSAEDEPFATFAEVHSPPDRVTEIRDKLMAFIQEQTADYQDVDLPQKGWRRFRLAIMMFPLDLEESEDASHPRSD